MNEFDVDLSTVEFLNFIDFNVCKVFIEVIEYEFIS